jgi:hypothetical protein
VQRPVKAMTDVTDPLQLRDNIPQAIHGNVTDVTYRYVPDACIAASTLCCCWEDASKASK